MRVRSARTANFGRIVDFCNKLSTFPLKGTQRDDLLSGLRVTGFERRVTIAFIVTAGGGAHRRHFLWRPGLRGGVSRSHVKFICAETLAYRDSRPVRGWGREEWGIGHWAFGTAAILG